jgi:hypothetical protein
MGRKKGGWRKDESRSEGAVRLNIYKAACEQRNGVTGLGLVAVPDLR